MSRYALCHESLGPPTLAPDATVQNLNGEDEKKELHDQEVCTNIPAMEKDGDAEAKHAPGQSLGNALSWSQADRRCWAPKYAALAARGAHARDAFFRQAGHMLRGSGTSQLNLPVWTSFACCAVHPFCFFMQDPLKASANCFLRIRLNKAEPEFGGNGLAGCHAETVKALTLPLHSPQSSFAWMLRSRSRI